jgi:hypothetical protein
MEEDITTSEEKTYCFSITRTNHLMLFGEIIAVHYKYHTETHKYILWVKCEDLLTLKQVVHILTKVLERGNRAEQQHYKAYYII